MKGEYYPHLIAYCTTPCPQCGGMVGFGDLSDWPAEHGGNHVGIYLSCSACSWSTDVYIEDDNDRQLPDEFFDSQGQLLGWSPDGRWLNGCEGPVFDNGIGKYP